MFHDLLIIFESHRVVKIIRLVQIANSIRSSTIAFPRKQRNSICIRTVTFPWAYKLFFTSLHYSYESSLRNKCIAHSRNLIIRASIIRDFDHPRFFSRSERKFGGQSIQLWEHFSLNPCKSSQSRKSSDASLREFSNFKASNIQLESISSQVITKYDTPSFLFRFFLLSSLFLPPFFPANRGGGGCLL